MKIDKKEHYSLFLFLSILPLSIILGSTISLLNIIIICLFFLFILFKEKNLEIKSNPIFKLLIILYLYLIFNSLISKDTNIGLGRNLGFIRFIILFICINYYFYKYPKVNNIFYVWILTLLILIFDTYVEHFSGSNIFGWGALTEPHGVRIVSFFRNEPVVGAYISSFVLILFGFLLDKFKFSNLLPWVFVLSALIAILLTGERSNTIKILMGFVLMFFFFNFLNWKLKIFLVVLFFSFIIVMLNKSNYLKERYIGQLLNNFSSQENIQNFTNKSDYFRLYKSGIIMFKNYPIFGVGNKNYRVEACSDNNQIYKYYCLTHPHQIYIELLSEHGLIGTIIILGIIFTLMFKILINIFVSKSYIQIGAFCYLVFIFTPLLPSGSYFNDFNSTLFWINFSIMYACSSKTNIFNYNLKS